MSVLNKIKGGLVVSCQALPDEPLHSSFIMGRMAIAAEQGGAIGIRANTKEDIAEIKQQTALPIIGIVKRDYAGSKVYITATMKEVDELMEVGCDIIALDATDQTRPEGQTLASFIKNVRDKYPDVLLMADASTIDEVINAEKLGFDLLSTTLMGYTEKSKGMNIADQDFEQMKQILAAVSTPVIAEGHIDTPEKAKRCLELGVHAVVVGSAITRPQLITEKFVNVMQ
ncbi:N-acetylmannosamine-6-phosphate 2-epimerase [Marinilactibacillus piezotolerans]|uniref:N-acetylmannosamine-6-phosphate 2-epimerase n=1 Tax=Marinilactibacillus piezotolerans TaxID=258723 RepID=UPI0009B0ABEA|nr:N-acetylmannosamine-6-phosphate 2-epimerase [Marinilactibacillus piezotolerans]